jgi:hypothetical protein
MVSEPVGNAELDYQRHDPYLAVLSDHAEAMSEAVARMASTAGAAARSQAADDLEAAEESMAAVESRARTFLGALSRAGCPAYLRGADAQLHDALKLVIDGGQRGAAAAGANDTEQLDSAASEMDVAFDDIEAAAGRIVDWRTGAARP